MDNNATENFAMFPENNYSPSLSQLDMEVFDEVMEEIDLPDHQPSVSFALNSETITPVPPLLLILYLLLHSQRIHNINPLLTLLRM